MQGDYTIIIKWILVSVLCTISIMSIGQNEKIVSSDTDIESNATREYINGVYIPADESEAYEEIIALAQGAGLEAFKSAVEDSIRGKLHFGIGGWIMKNWYLEQNSRLYIYLKDRGLLHPDDMVEYLIIGFHRHLNEVDYRYEELIEEFRLIRKAKADERKRQKLKNGTLLKTLPKLPD